MPRRTLIALVFVLASCSGSAGRLSTTPKVGANYEKLVQNDYSSARFAVTIVPRAGGKLCISAPEWPNTEAGLSNGGNAYFVESGTRRYAKGYEYGFCVKDSCSVKIPESGLTGYIKFSEFGDAAAKISRTTEIHFTEHVFACHS